MMREEVEGWAVWRSGALSRTRTVVEGWEKKMTGLEEDKKRLEDGKAKFKELNDKRIIRHQRLILKEAESTRRQQTLDAAYDTLLLHQHNLDTETDTFI